MLHIKGVWRRLQAHQRFFNHLESGDYESSLSVHRSPSLSATAIPTTRPPAADHMARLPDQVLTSSPQYKLHQLFQPPVMPPVLHQKSSMAFSHNKWITIVVIAAPLTGAYRRLQRASVLVFMRAFYFLWKDGSEIGACLTTSWAADITLPALARVRCVHHAVTAQHPTARAVRKVSELELLTSINR